MSKRVGWVGFFGFTSESGWVEMGGDIPLRYVLQRHAPGAGFKMLFQLHVAHFENVCLCLSYLIDLLT